MCSHVIPSRRQSSGKRNGESSDAASAVASVAVDATSIGGRKDDNNSIKDSAEDPAGPSRKRTAERTEGFRANATTNNTDAAAAGTGNHQPIGESHPPSASPSITCRSTLNIVSLNLNGSAGEKELDGISTDLGKFEQIALQMEEQQWDVLLAQETWREGTWRKRINGITVFHHGPDRKQGRRGRGGMAIFLGPRAKKAWNNAGNPDLTQPGPLADDVYRFMGITLRFAHKKGERTFSETFFVGNIYAPDSGTVERASKKGDPDMRDRFFGKVDNILGEINANTQVIIGGDFNASVGIRPPPPPPPPRRPERDTTNHRTIWNTPSERSRSECY